MTLQWNPPESDGGSHITGYVLEKKEAYSVRWFPCTSQSILKPQFTVKDLKEGAQYEFRVMALNKAGLGPPSDGSELATAKSKFGMFISN